MLLWIGFIDILLKLSSVELIIAFHLGKIYLKAIMVMVGGSIVNNA